MRVRWLRQALKALDDEASYISREDPAMAQIVVERVLSAAATLASQPAIGRPGRVPGTREWVVPQTRLLLPYRVRGSDIEILAVFHTSRRLPKGW